MTSHDEQRLGDALRCRADSTEPHLLSFDDVTSRAGSIRRRRIATGVVAAAAVVAVVVPTAMVATGSTDRSDPGFATNTPTPAVTQDVTLDPSPTDPVTPTGRHQDVSVLGDLPTGAAPKILVRIGSQVLLPDGTRVEVGSDAVHSALVDGRVVTLERDGDGNGTFVVRDTSGSVEVQEPADIDGALSVTPDRTAAAYVGTDGRIHTWSEADGDLTFSAPLKHVQLGPLLGSGGSCKEQAPEGGGCTVFYSTADGHARYATSHGIDDQVPGFVMVNSAHEERLAGQTESLPAGSCSEIRRSMGTTSLLRTCDFLLETFSPDGLYVTGGPAYGDGLGPASVDVLDAATGKSLLTISAAGEPGVPSYIPQLGWEDDSHLLASVFDGKAWRLVRIGLDGSAELADAGPMPSGDVGEVPLRLDAGA
jgi:hypothetical protein